MSLSQPDCFAVDLRIGDELFDVLFEDFVDELLRIFGIEPEDFIAPAAQHPFLNRAFIGVVGHTDHHRILRGDFGAAELADGVD